MLKLKSLFPTLFSIAMFISCTSVAQQSSEGGWLWKISGNGLSQSSYLFGTYHGTYNILYEYVDSIPKFHEAFNACNQYVGEVIKPKDLGAVATELNVKMPKDTTYTNLLNKEDYLFLDSIVNRYFKTHLNSMFIKPSYLSIILGKMQEAEELKKTGYSQTQIDSINSHVMDGILELKAKEKGYTLIGLETITEQINMLISDIDLKKQASTLIKSLRENNEYSQFLSLSKTLPDIYHTQNIQNLIDFEAKTDSLYQNSPGLKELGKHQREVLLKQRNINWIEKIPELIKDKSTFIAVGVRHLPGKNGLITLLREKGYRVEALQ